jgi:HAMP domain-containing protein
MKAVARACRAASGWTWLALLSGPALAESAEDIHDIRGPKAVPVAGSSTVAAALAGALVVALCAYAVWRRRHRPASPPAPTLSEATLQRLESVRTLMRPATAREFGIAASEVIRDYIEKRFDVVATQRTTEEFLQTLLQSPNEVLARHRSLLAEFLEQCDFVKFAGASLAVADMESLYGSARGFVLETAGPTVA